MRFLLYDYIPPIVLGALFDLVLCGYAATAIAVLCVCVDPPHPSNVVPCAPNNMRSLAEQLVADARADGTIHRYGLLKRK